MYRSQFLQSKRSNVFIGRCEIHMSQGYLVPYSTVLTGGTYPAGLMKT
jgi:hypothetical protein